MSVTRHDVGVYHKVLKFAATFSNLLRIFKAASSDVAPSMKSKSRNKYSRGGAGSCNIGGGSSRLFIKTSVGNYF